MPNVRDRVNRLERAAGGPDDGLCACPGEITIVWDDTGEPARPFCSSGETPEPEPPAEVCPTPRRMCERCGRPVQVVTVTWEAVLEGDAP